MVPAAGALQNWIDSRDPRIVFFRQAYQEATTLRERKRQTWEQVVQLLLPHRAPMFNKREEDCIGQSYTSAPMDAVHEYASSLENGLTPFFQKWLSLRAGWGVPPMIRKQVNRALQQPSDQMFGIMQSSNFYTVWNQLLRDNGVGTSFICVEDDPLRELTFRAEPWAKMAILDDANGEPAMIFRERELPNWQIRQQYPFASWTPSQLDAFEQGPFKKTTLVDGVIAQHSRAGEAWDLLTVCQGVPVDQLRLEGAGSCPWITFRWDKTAESPWGVGPLIYGLPDAKVLNFMAERRLHAVDLATVGMWQYDDDGIINPKTIQLQPGTFIPRAAGGRGIEPLKAGVDVDWARMELLELEAKFRRRLYLDRFGPVEGPVKSATEIMQRQIDLARVIGSPYVRMVMQMAQIVQRSAYLLARRGLLNLPSINGRAISLQTVGPYSRAQGAEDVGNLQQFALIVQQTFGPEAAALAIKVPAWAEAVADYMQVPGELLNTEQERMAMVQTGLQMQQQLGAQ